MTDLATGKSQLFVASPDYRQPTSHNAPHATIYHLILQDTPIPPFLNLNNVVLALSGAALRMPAHPPVAKYSHPSSVLSSTMQPAIAYTEKALSFPLPHAQCLSLSPLPLPVTIPYASVQGSPG